MHINNKKILNRFSFKKGVTLVEMMVVISIFLVITSVVIFNYENFYSSVSLQNLTDDIALAVRKAQSFAIGARGIKDGVNTNFSNSYGVHFSAGSEVDPLIASSNSFMMFSSSVNNKVYDAGGTGECGEDTNNCIEKFKITSQDIIKEILINDGTVTLPTDSYLDISFARPDPRAYFCYRTNINSTTCENQSISNVSIVISNGITGDEEKLKVISIQNTGQISIKSK